jgi:hypothetical protein
MARLDHRLGIHKKPDSGINLPMVNGYTGETLTLS